MQSNRFLTFAAPLLAASLFCPVSMAQVKSVSVDSSSVQLACPTVSFAARVLDSKNTPIPGLTAANFSLTENGQQRTFTVTQKTQSGGQLSVSILIDISGSIDTDLVYEQQAAVALVKAMPAGTAFELITIDTFSSVVLPFTSDSNAVINAINSLSLGGGTSLFEAIQLAAADLSGRSGGHAIVLMTDGLDNGYSTVDAAIAAAQQASASVYTVGFGGADTTTLNFISSSTGGASYSAGQATDLAQTLSTISSVLNTTYQISFSSSSTTQTANLVLTVTAGGAQASQTVKASACMVAVAPTLSSVQPNSAPMGSPATAVTLAGANFVNGAKVAFTGPAGSTTLNASFVSAAQLQATLPASVLTTPGTAQVAVFNPDNKTTAALPFTITPVAPSGLGLQAKSVASPTDQAPLEMALGAPSPLAYHGTLTLSFTPDASVTGLPANYRDPATQFVAGGTTMPFDIAAGATSIALPNSGLVQQGTVAGQIKVVLADLKVPATGQSVTLSSPVSATITVAPLAPVIQSVAFKDVSATGFTLEIRGYSTTRDLRTASFTFSPAAGSALNGGSQTLSLASAATTYFAATEGLGAGGQFLLSVPFPLTGDLGALGSVSVTLQNAIGTSQAVSGSR